MEQWPERRREHFVSQGAVATDVVEPQHDQGGVAVDGAAGLSGGAGGPKLDPFKCEIHRLLKREPDMRGQRVRELIASA